jgi:O-antigen ligase
MERLTFNVGSSRHAVVAGRADRVAGRPANVASLAAAPTTRERYDWDYLWMLAFTALLFFRPQDQIPGLEALHLAELTAIAGLAAMAVRRLGAGLAIVKVNAEMAAVVALGAIIVLTIPFSIWPGGSLKVFSDIYVKIILIFALMMSTLTSPKRIRQMTWIMIAASSYIAARAIFDYVRGVNLVEGNRVRGAVGGMFENPNDLALNLVTFLAPTLFIVIQDRRASRRLLGALFAVTMAGAIVCTKSRSGFLGLVIMGAVVAYYTMRMRPGIVLAGVLAAAVALPAMPSSFWDRMDSIVNEDEDTTGSRSARLRLIDQGLEVFAENPLTGVGAGQFKNYNAPGVTIEKWRVTHNVWLQVASELGVFGLAIFAFLVLRAYTSCFAVMRALRQRRKRFRPSASSGRPEPVEGAIAPFDQLRASRAGRRTDRGLRNPPAEIRPPQFSQVELTILDQNAKGMFAAIVGWTVCSLFASVAFNWTLYYVLALAVAGREIVRARMAESAQAEEHRAPVRADRRPGPRLVKAHA